MLRQAMGWLLVGVVGVAWGPAAYGDEAEERQRILERLAELEERLDASEDEKEELRKKLQVLERRLFDAEADADAGVEVGDDDGIPESTLSGTAIGLGERYEGGRGGIFDKPFLENVLSRTYVGGYFDLEYRDEQNEDRTFRFHRFVPFIYSQINEQLRFAAEIEFEDGGPDTPAGDGEVKVEFATLDYVIAEWLGIRAGAILVPLGKFNLIHDSPVNDLTDRPLVSRRIIPTTFTEAGIGVFGTVFPSDESKLDYELYLVNGFRGLEEDPSAPTGFTSNLTESGGVRAGRASLKVDNNNSLAGTGRIAFSPLLGVEMGASAHAGRYDDKGDNTLVIWAIDGTIEPARFVPALAGVEVLGEVARAEIERDTLARASGVADDMWGYYVQTNYHFMPPCLRDMLPRVFKEESTFTAVVRLGHIELDDERTQRITFGLNFRPIEDTVFKFDYQLNFEDWGRTRVDNDAFLFSVASYF